MGRKNAAQVSEILRLGLLWLLVKLVVPGVDGVFVNRPAQPEHAGQRDQMYYKDEP
jgi:hypothetical protein